MARGTRTNLATLAGVVGENSPVDRPAAGGTPTNVPLSELAPNPRNPRDDLGDLSDLVSITGTQLQPALVVTRDAYLRLYPEDESKIGLARWVVINGCRRLAAAENFGRPNLDIVVKDEVAKDRETLLAAAVIENVGRRDFDVIEEAKAVELLINECGTVDKAALKLNKSKAWISYRRSLLKLAPELQTALRNGELAVRTARSLAQVPPEAQVQAWAAEQQREHKKPDPDPAPESENRLLARAPVTAAKVTRTFRRLEADPTTLADALVDYLDADGLQTLIQALTDRH
ncbi:MULTISPECIES: ParB/RepB/Spo0J family partition protein [Rhodococcus]|uniref:ParB/RepB/Spo0J family partition protein n=1 Tax=Rhodococcus TaxID=1827 RepID=UPI002952EFE4|nr:MULTISPECIES: ParB/RepB/Spo0J family partition protein [Rhodococcus]MDV7246260.1 ParB/RepB/Spo0J family partition protein [Rhodococcus oxybenzonivorans]MDV7337268.1 ParB/RepB/Spo0J family partition protein [Rhodococcus oxybenzonivorans]MDV8030744.1 ParB/RepB/Spo0J family partition protein [Rhodococcus sp. IEGM 27]